MLADGRLGLEAHVEGVRPRTRLHGGGGPHVGEVTRVIGSNPPLHVISYFI